MKGCAVDFTEFRAAAELLGMLLTDLRSLTLLLLLLAASICDLRTRRIPNVLTFGGAALALLYSLAAPHHGVGPLRALGGLGLGLALMLPLYLLRAMGAGDVKLMGALALATSPPYVLGTFIGAGITVLAWLLGRRRLWILLNPKVKKRLQKLAEEVGDKQPFAPYVLVGFLLTAVWIQ